MPARRTGLTGPRVRERRLDIGMRQADLARAAGISPSYLNLIEHNRRRIGGKLLRTLAEVLGVSPQTLSEGAEVALLDGLRAAATRVGAEAVETARVEDFAGRFPGWAGLVIEQDRRITSLESRVESLYDRMSHDPALASALHEIISTATSIRASSGILVGEEEIDADWQRRFQRNIDDDARRLAEGSAALVSFLKASADAEARDGAAQSFLLPSEQAAAFLRDAVPGLAARVDEAPPDAEAIAGLVAESRVLRSPSARALAQFHLGRVAEDAARMPTQALLGVLRSRDWDPAAVARHFGTDLPAALRRIAALPSREAGRPAGLAICDGAGTYLHVQPTAGFDLPRAGGACPRWPLFRALSAPGQPLIEEIALPGTSGGRFRCYAVAAARDAPDFGRALAMEATMLVLPFSGGADGGSAPDTAGDGYGCPVCRRPDCTAGRDPFATSA